MGGKNIAKVLDMSKFGLVLFGSLVFLGGDQESSHQTHDEQNVSFLESMRGRLTRIEKGNIVGLMGKNESSNFGIERTQLGLEMSQDR